MILAKVDMEAYEKACREWSNPWGCKSPREPIVWRWNHREPRTELKMFKSTVVMPREPT